MGRVFEFFLSMRILSTVPLKYTAGEVSCRPIFEHTYSGFELPGSIRELSSVGSTDATNDGRDNSTKCKKRSKASRRTSQLRQIQRKAKHCFSGDGDRLAALVLMQGLVTSASFLDCPFARSIDSDFALADSTLGRQRDLFPLGPVPANLVDQPQWSVLECRKLRSIVSAQVKTLNWLFGCRPDVKARSVPLAGQVEGFRRLVKRAVDFTNNLMRATEDGTNALLPSWALGRDGTTHQSDLIADRVDVLETAGLLDPLVAFDTDERRDLFGIDTIFPSVAPCLSIAPSVSCDRKQYVLLTVRQLRAGQLGLACKARGHGTVFAVSKKGSTKQRAVWHGSLVSSASVPPPCPPHLATPSALTSLHCGQSDKFYVSKRDASCWFDQLLLPAELRLFMGRPRVSLNELSEIGGMSAAEIQSSLEADTDSDLKWYTPVSRVWPMGFAWSSFVAQNYLLHLCDKAGLTADRALSCDTRSPEDCEITFGAATDDVMIFSRGDATASGCYARRLDEVFMQAGAQRNTRKDVNDQTCATCVGVDLKDGTSLIPPPDRCRCIIVCLLILLQKPFASPREVSGLLGMIQWLDLLRRPKLAIFDKVYTFTKISPDTVRVRVPHNVLGELLAGVLLGAYWEFDLRMPYLPLLSATDASTSFGFGASVAHVELALIERLSKLAEKQGGFVVLDQGTISGPAAASFGEKVKVDIGMDEFVDVLAVRARCKSHINLLEGDAFILWIKWLLRSRKHFGKRIVVLVDSAVWLGAACKGRSSSILNRLLRKVAALTMFGDVMLNVVFTPSAENPADRPSRGYRRGRGKKKCTPSNHQD